MPSLYFFVVSSISPIYHISSRLSSIFYSYFPYTFSPNIWHHFCTLLRPLLLYQASVLCLSLFRSPLAGASFTSVLPLRFPLLVVHEKSPYYSPVKHEMSILSIHSWHHTVAVLFSPTWPAFHDSLHSNVFDIQYSILVLVFALFVSFRYMHALSSTLLLSIYLFFSISPLSVYFTSTHLSFQGASHSSHFLLLSACIWIKNPFSPRGHRARSLKCTIRACVRRGLHCDAAVSPGVQRATLFSWAANPRSES